VKMAQFSSELHPHRGQKLEKPCRMARYVLCYDTVGRSLTVSLSRSSYLSSFSIVVS
jgi:hypothetical protein